MSEPIRILHVFAALDSGGVSNFVMNLYRGIDTNRIQFDFALTSGKRSLFDEEVLMRGGRIFYFDATKSISSNLRMILRQQGPFQAVHSHVFFYSGVVLAVAKKAKVPIRIAHAHNAYTGEARSLFRLVYESGMKLYIHRNATHLLGCSEKACHYLFGKVEMFNSRVEVVPDGIDLLRFSFNPRIREKIRREYGLCGKFVVGHVGHFNPSKNHEKLLSVFAEIARNRDDAALLLVGDGELEHDIRKYTAKLGVSEKVVFVGARKDVERFYQAMDVFVFPSRYEGFGMAMIEAQCNGLACIASDVVPKETNIDGRAIFLPLMADDSVWAEQVSTAPRREVFESKFMQKICWFSIDNTVEKVSRIYLS